MATLKKCAQCEAEGLRSSIDELGGWVTTACGWEGYDEDGVRHSHNPNISTDDYRCSNGHRWSEKRQSACPAADCSWNESRGLKPPIYIHASSVERFFVDGPDHPFAKQG